MGNIEAANKLRSKLKGSSKKDTPKKEVQNQKDTAKKAK